MTDDGADADIDHLLAATVRDRLDDGDGSGWRPVEAPDAVQLDFGFPFPESFPPGELLAATEAVFDAEAGQALQYTGGRYMDRLDEAIVERERSRGIDCGADDVVVTNGAVHAIDLVSRAVLEPGDEVITGAPTFMAALERFRTQGATVTGIEVDEDGLRVDALAAQLDRRRADGQPTPTLVYTIPTFQNPTGTTMPRARRERLVELAAEHDFLVLEDDAYGALRYDGEPVAPLAALDDAGRVLRVSTFSKTVAPGVRTGWLVADPTVRAAVEQVRGGGTNTFTRSVLGRYCTDGPFEENLAELRAAYATRRDRMCAALDDHMPPETDRTDPAGGFFVWVELPAGLDAEALLTRAAEEGVVYLPGGLFFPDEGGERHLRLSFSHVSPAAIDRGIAALGRAARDATVET